MQTGEIICLILVGIVFLIFTHVTVSNFLHQICYTPLSIYNESSMNWFGTICVYILIFPFSFILGIGGFLRWLFTVGRRY